MSVNADLRSSVVEQLPYLRRFARALAGNGAAADGLVQEALESALKRLHLYDPDYHLRTWLYAILRNLHVRNLRRDAGAPPPVEFTHVPDFEISMEGSDGERLLMVDLAKALEALPYEQKEVVILVGMEQLPYDDAADVVGVPVGTLMSRLSRGRKRLRDILKSGNINSRDDGVAFRSAG